MIDHFNQLKIGDRPVDGSLTLNENIADQGGAETVCGSREALLYLVIGYPAGGCD